MYLLILQQRAELVQDVGGNGSPEKPSSSVYRCSHERSLDCLNRPGKTTHSKPRQKLPRKFPGHISVAVQHKFHPRFGVPMTCDFLIALFAMRVAHAPIGWLRAVLATSRLGKAPPHLGSWEVSKTRRHTPVTNLPKLNNLRVIGPFVCLDPAGGSALGCETGVKSKHRG